MMGKVVASPVVNMIAVTAGSMMNVGSADVN